MGITNRIPIAAAGYMPFSIFTLIMNEHTEIIKANELIKTIAESTQRMILFEILNFDDIAVMEITSMNKIIAVLRIVCS